MRHQSRARTEARGRIGCFAAGMAATDNHDIEVQDILHAGG